MRVFTTDAIHGAVQKDGVSPTDTEGEFTFDDDDTVVIENQPWQDAFDTKEFHSFDVVVARPLDQTYTANERIAAALDVDVGETVTLKKPAAELRRSAWALDNSPTPITHPNSGVVSSPDQVHGFVRNPTWDDEVEELRAEGYVPTDDDFAKSFISEYGDVSVGFFNDLDPDVDDEDVDAYQRSILYDHVAHVQHGRCAGSEGCGVVRDDSQIGTMLSHADGDEHPHDGSERPDVDYSRSPVTGEWVKWSTDDEIHHGRVEDGDTERTIVHVYDGPEPTDENVGVATSNLREWVGPNVDHCPGDTCSCGCHKTVDEGGNDDVSPSEAVDEQSTLETDSATPDDSTNSTTMTDDSTQDDGQTTAPSFDVDDLSVDAVRARHDDVDEKITDLEETVGSLESDLDEAEEQKKAAQSTVDDLKETVSEYQRDEAEEIIDDIVDLTDTWEKDTLLDDFEEGDLSLDKLEERREWVQDVAATETTVGDSETTTDSSDSEYTEYTPGQTYDLRDTA